MYFSNTNRVIARVCAHKWDSLRCVAAFTVRSGMLSRSAVARAPLIRLSSLFVYFMTSYDVLF